MNPFRIEPNEWKEFYREAMLISDYEGLAYIKQKVYKQEEVPCLACSNSEQIKTSTNYVLQKYLKANPYEKLMHWNCIGDITTGSNMEEFSLYDNIEYYRYSCQNTWCGTRDIDMEKTMSSEMLFDYIYPEDYDMKYATYELGTTIVMAGKTQGECGHMGLLEIGCLLADRFPDSVTVRGDISYAQCVRAAAQVKEILGRTIRLPERYDYTIVFERLSKIVDARTDLLRLFNEIYDGPKEQAFYNLIKLNFTDKEIGHYYVQEYDKGNKVRLIEEWFQQETTLEKLCEVIVDTYSTQETYSEEIRAFIGALIKCKIHVANKEFRDSTEFNSVYRSTPDTVETQFSKLLRQLAGLRDNYVNKYIPIEELIAICVEYFGEHNNVKEMFEEAIDKVANDEGLQCKDRIHDTITSLDDEAISQKDVTEVDSEENSEEDNEEDAKYDHVDYCTLCVWESGDTIHPELEENLLIAIEKFKEFGERRKKEYAKPSRYGGNVGDLTDLKNFIKFISESTTHTKLFKEDDLDYLLSKKFPRGSTLGSVIIGLYLVKVNYSIETLVSSFFLNFKLLEFYVNKLEEKVVSVEM